MNAMRSADVTAAAQAAQDSIHQRLTPEERLAAAIEMSDFARSLAEAGARMRNPGASDDQIRQMLIAALYPARRAR